MRGWGLTAIVGLGLWLGPGASASAADFYVDRDVADGSVTCTLASPCETIAEGIALADASDLTTDTVHVGRSAAAYAVGVTIPDTPMTLIGGDFNAGTDGPTSIIDGNASAGISFTFASGTPRTVTGLTIRGGDGGPTQSLNGGGTVAGITVIDNTFDEAAPALTAHISLNGSPQIIGNTIDGINNLGGDSTLGMIIDVGISGAPTITGNTIDGVERPIYILGNNNTTTSIAENTLEVAGQDSNPEAGISLIDATGIMRDNLITGDAVTPGDNGIYSQTGTGAPLQLQRNQIYGLAESGVALNTDDPVSLNGDVIAFNAGAGVTDFITPAPLTISNATLFNNTLAEVFIDDTGSVNIDSTIIGPQGVIEAGGPSAVCTSTFSRGPTPNPGICSYATTASPLFTGFALDGTGFHLTANNPALIDMGNPAAAAGTDRDGDSLLIDGLANSSCAPRRDIGADEVTGLSTDCPPPAAATPGPTGQRAAALKKCKKKKKKKKSGKARKKCRKKAQKLPV